MSAFRGVVLDCDGTLSSIEGIDALAAGAHEAEIEALTARAMRGEVPLEEVYGRRLEIVRPDRARVERLGSQYIAALQPGAHTLVRGLREAGIAVRIMSGGLRPAVAALGRELGIEGDDVAAVDIFFSADGAYAGFDTASPLARSGGKPEVLARWLAGEGGRPPLPRPVLVVGDGATDLEARPPADAFAAYTGVFRREAVVEGADFVAGGMKEVMEVAIRGGLGGW